MPPALQLDIAVPPQGGPRVLVLRPGVGGIRPGGFLIHQHAHALFHRQAFPGLQVGLHAACQRDKEPHPAVAVHRLHHQFVALVVHRFQQPHGFTVGDHLVVMDGQVGHPVIHHAFHLHIAALLGRQGEPHADKLRVGHAGHALGGHLHMAVLPALGIHPGAQVQLVADVFLLMPGQAQAQHIGQLHQVGNPRLDVLVQPGAEHGVIVQQTLGLL